MTRIAQLAELLVVLEQENQKLSAEVEESRRFKYLSSMATAVAHEINQAATSGALSDIRDNLFQPTELEPLLNKIYAQTERLKNIIESFRIAWANPFQLEEVLINLLNNAKDALEGFANPQVWIKTGRTVTGATEIQVEDNGPGIAPEFLEKLFMPFESTKPTERGTGLGLHISRKIIEALGGTLNYTARNGGGASFNITFPPLSESIEREERDPLCSDEDVEEDEFEGWETKSEISFGSPKPSLEETEEEREEREEREEQEAEEDRLYGGWKTESSEEDVVEVYGWEDEEEEGVLSTPASRSEH